MILKIFNLLITTICCFFNASNISILGNNDDVIFDKQQIKYAFDNSNYLSRVTNIEAYQYFSNDYSYSYVGVVGGGYNGWANFDNSTSGYGSLGSIDLSTSENYYEDNVYTRGINEVINVLNNEPNTTNIVFSDAGKHVDNYYMMFRFFVPYNNPIQNIEFEILSSYGIDNNRLYYGVGFPGTINDFAQYGYSSVELNQNLSILISDNSRLYNTQTEYNPLLPVYLGKLSQYWFAFNCRNSVGSGGSAGFSIRVHYLGSFDASYQQSYNDGYNAGVSTGLAEGYQNGYTDGYNDADNLDSTALTIFTGILEIGILPVNVFLAIFNFEVFGINISGIVSGLLTISIVMIILRFLLGGKSKDD